MGPTIHKKLRLRLLPPPYVVSCCTIGTSYRVVTAKFGTCYYRRPFLLLPTPTVYIYMHGPHGTASSQKPASSQQPAASSQQLYIIYIYIYQHERARERERESTASSQHPAAGIIFSCKTSVTGGTKKKSSTAPTSSTIRWHNYLVVGSDGIA